MPVEIEKKFLLRDVSILSSLDEGVDYVQAYLNEDPERTVRVRIAGDSAFLTVKGKTKVCTKPEFEYKIPLEDAREMILLCKNVPIEKTRYKIPQQQFCWEIDVFHGANEGLILAEIELYSETDVFDLPYWIGEEVTTDFRYYNSYLSSHPFRFWDQ